MSTQIEYGTSGYHETGLLKADPRAADALVVDYIFQAIHTRGVDTERDARIEAGYRKWCGRPMMVTERDLLRPPYFRGFPGQGKTAVIVSAAKKVAAMCGYKFAYRPTDDHAPSKDEMVLNVLELAGEQSNVVVGGIPSKQEQIIDGVSVSYMGKLPSKMLSEMKFYGAAILFLDDFPQANIPVQTSLLSALLDNRFQSLDLGRSVAFAMAGNIGGLDGTLGVKDTASITSRTQTLLLCDEVDLFMHRAMKRFAGQPYSDGHLCSFIRQNQGLFFNPEDVKANGVPFSTSRQLEALLEQARQACHWFAFNTTDKAEDPHSGPVEMLKVKAAALCGEKMSKAIASYYTCMFRDRAAPLAEAVFLEKGLTDKRVVDDIIQRMGTGANMNSNEMNFSQRFAEAAASIAATEWVTAYKGNDETRQSQILATMSALVFAEPLQLADGTKTIMMSQDNRRELMSRFVYSCACVLDDKNSVYYDFDVARPIVDHRLADKWFDSMALVRSACALDMLYNKPQIQVLFNDVIAPRFDEASTDILDNAALLDSAKAALNAATQPADQQAQAALSNGMSGFDI